MKAVVQAIKYCDPEEREDAANHFRVEWAQGGIYWMRTAFLDGARYANEIFCRATFRSLFATQVLKLAHDPVSNVRLKVGYMMGELSFACRDMPEYLAALEELTGDEDGNVRDSVAQMSKKELEDRDERQLLTRDYEKCMDEEAILLRPSIRKRPKVPLVPSVRTVMSFIRDVERTPNSQDSSPRLNDENHTSASAETNLVNSDKISPETHPNPDTGGIRQDSKLNIPHENLDDMDLTPAPNLSRPSPQPQLDADLSKIPSSRSRKLINHLFKTKQSSISTPLASRTPPPPLT